MKKLFLFLSLALLFSCSVQKRKYQGGYYVDWHARHSQKETRLTVSKKTSIDKKATPVQKAALAEKEEETFAAAAGITGQELKKSRSLSKLPEDTCDVLVFKDGSEIRAKIQEMGVSEIKYKRCDNAEGPLYTSKKSDLFMVKYANGTREVIKSETPPQQSPQQIQRPPQNLKNYKQERYKKQNHPLAVAALLLGVLSLLFGYFILLTLSAGLLVAGAVYFLPFLAALGAVITGKTALNRIRQQPEVFKGKGMAMPGFIMGMVVLGIYTIILFVFILLLGLI